METTTFTRKELYDLVWSKPLSAVIKKYETSYALIRKACSENNIPLPENGYWSKIQFGKPVKEFELPIDDKKNNESIVVLKKTTKRITNQIFNNKESESSEGSSVNVPERLVNPDPLIVKTREYLKGKKPKYNDGLVHSGTNYLNIIVSPTNIPRSLRIMDALIKQINSMGYEFYVENEKTNAVIFGQKITILIQEKTKYQRTTDKSGWTSSTRVPRGRLTFRYYTTFAFNQRIIEEGQEQLEKKLSQIINGLESLAQEEKNEREKWERYRAQQEEERRIESERIRKLKEDEANFETLINQALRWQQSKIIREYLIEIESQSKINDKLTPELIEWLVWARNKTNKYDPLKN